jgi:hypothetical protein
MKMRVVWVLVAVVVAVVLIVVAATQWDNASKFLAVVSTVAAIAAVGVAVWQGRLALAAVRVKPDPALAVEGTGPAVAEGDGSTANTGFEGPADLPGSTTLKDTGRAEGSDGGSANTGIKFT